MPWKLALMPLLMLVAAPCVAAELWQKAQSGMTRQQVKTAFPNANPPKATSTLHGGAKCELAIENYNVASADYRVCFFFFSGKLTQVTLNANAPTRSDFESVVDLLRAKYGSEIGAGAGLCHPGMMLRCEAKWLLKSGTNVGVLFLQVGQNEPMMNVNYQTRMASEASKL